jgi:hypothetical protein
MSPRCMSEGDDQADKLGVWSRSREKEKAVVRAPLRYGSHPFVDTPLPQVSTISELTIVDLAQGSIPDSAQYLVCS